MLPKRNDEKVEPFRHLDDAEFAVIRRKLARWAADNAQALKDAQPTVPAGLNNRVAMNWWLLLAIAELAGEQWAKSARSAAEQLSRRGHQPSDGVELLARIRDMAARSGAKVLASETIVAELLKDQVSIWGAYHRGGPVSQRQVAFLLRDYEIFPGTVHPPGFPPSGAQGYKLAQFADVFARYDLPDDPSEHPSVKTVTKTKAKSNNKKSKSNNKKSKTRKRR